MRIEPVVLAGHHVTLEPLALEHVPALCVAGRDPSIWEFMIESATTEAEMRSWVETALRDQARGVALPFATRDAASSTVVGTTRFGNIEPSHKRVEIGWTWIAPRWQRTAINTEAKLLMLRHAFETWRCRRVEFKTDALNERSRAALLRIGAREEGTLRCHMQTGTGRVRDSVYYSVVESEWPSVRARLETRLDAAR